MNNLLGRFDFVQFQCVSLKNMDKKAHTTVAKSDVERFIRGMGRRGGGGRGEEPCVSDMFSIPELGRKDTRAARSPPWALDSLHPRISHRYLSKLWHEFRNAWEYYIKDINLFRTFLICKPVAVLFDYMCRCLYPRPYICQCLFPYLCLSMRVSIKSVTSSSVFVSAGVSVSGCVHSVSICQSQCL